MDSFIAWEQPEAQPQSMKVVHKVSPKKQKCLQVFNYEEVRLKWFLVQQNYFKGAGFSLGVKEKKSSFVIKERVYRTYA